MPNEKIPPKSPLAALDPVTMRKVLRDRDASTGDVSDLVAQMNDYLGLIDSIDVSLSVLALIAEKMAIKHEIVTSAEIANLRVTGDASDSPAEEK